MKGAVSPPFQERQEYSIPEKLKFPEKTKCVHVALCAVSTLT